MRVGFVKVGPPGACVRARTGHERASFPAQRHDLGMDRQSPTDPLDSGRFGDYVVAGILGEGGMGRVYDATGPDGKRVALKLVKDDYARDETFRRRFSREARIAQTIEHPNVVPVTATGEYNGIPYMAQRFIDGMSLEQKLKRDGPLDVPYALRICADVASGLEALWAAGMVHRDVKPGNILLDGQDRAYITDFGLAKDTQASLLTLPGQALGSMDYMAPEQIRGETLGAAADIYALGCVMYESLCGEPPFAKVQGMRVLWAHLQDEPPDPCQLRSDLSPEFARTLRLALQKDPDPRPASAGEYARMLAVVAAATVVVTSGEPADTTLETVTETVVAKASGISPDALDPGILIEASCNVLVGATATSAVIRVRRGTTTAGTLVSKALTAQIAAEAPDSGGGEPRAEKASGLSITVLDEPEGEQAGLSYVLTIECPGATTNRRVKGAALSATF
jgi:serine/threonine-protein kinase